MKLKSIISRDLLHEDKDAKFSEIIKAYLQYSTFRLRVWLRISQYVKSHKIIGGGYYAPWFI